jgi:rhodanese-related sulfurtransferase
VVSKPLYRPIAALSRGFETHLECLFLLRRKKMSSWFKRFVSSMILIGLLSLVFLATGGWSADNKSYQNISLDQFVKMFEQKDFILINVHIPYQGEIPATDLLVPFNQIDQHGNDLPKDKDKKIVVYCMTGPMGYYAAENLAGLGYSKVIHFEGGMKAWSRSGRQLEYRKK